MKIEFTKFMLANSTYDHVAVGMTEVTVCFCHMNDHLMLGRKRTAAVTTNWRFRLTRNLSRNMTNHMLHDLAVGSHSGSTKETLK